MMPFLQKVTKSLFNIQVDSEQLTREVNEELDRLERLLHKGEQAVIKANEVLDEQPRARHIDHRDSGSDSSTDTAH